MNLQKVLNLNGVENQQKKNHVQVKKTLFFFRIILKTLNFLIDKQLFLEEDQEVKVQNIKKIDNNFKIQPKV